MATTWNPQQYLRFGEERSQPFFDLLHRIPAIGPVTRVVDLGCGPGQLTGVLAERYPDADVVGIDSSPAMIDAAAAHAAPRVSFELADAVARRPAEPLDVIVSNAALQWIDGHEDHLTEWLGWLRPGGVLAFQVPGNFDAPSHRSIAEQVRSERWRPHIDPAVLDRPRSRPPELYLDRLLDAGAATQVWETTYLHVLAGADPVLQWLRGTGLRPVLQALPAELVDEFEAELAGRLARCYPTGPHGTVLPFRRIFAVAVSASSVNGVSGGR